MQLAFDVFAPPGEREQNLPPVIMLHGMMDSRKTWGIICKAIAQNTGRKVYALDARNHGDSPWNDDITFDILADDLAEFMSQQNIRKAALIGHSMGGRTALTLALKRPEMVEKFVSEDMSLQKLGPLKEGVIIQLLNVLRASLDNIPPNADELTAKTAIAEFVQGLLTAGSNLTEEQAMFYRKKKNISFDAIPLIRDGATYRWKTNLDALEKFITTDKIQQTFSGVYKGDALFLYGTKSFLKVDRDRLLFKHFPRAVKIPFEGTSHLVHFERTGRFIKEASNFINGCRNDISKL